MEFEAHPAPRVVYTLILEMHRNKRTPNIIKCIEEEWGNKEHNISASIKPINGARRNG